MLPLLPDDTNTRVMCAGTPFYKWLSTHEQPCFIEALRIYLEVGAYGKHPGLNQGYVNTYRNIHTSYYWVQHNEKMRQEHERTNKQGNPI